MRYYIVNLKPIFSTTTLPEIEAAIEQLSQDDMRQLSGWLQEYLEQRWDVQIEADLGAGRLDNLIAKAEVDIAANKVKALDEVLGQHLTFGR